MYEVINSVKVDSYEGKDRYLVTIAVDTAADLPTPEENWCAGSIAEVYENDGMKYKLRNNRTWTPANFTGAEKDELYALKDLAESLGADASGCSTNLEALNVISVALGGSGDSMTNAQAIDNIKDVAAAGDKTILVCTDTSAYQFFVK